MSYTQSKRHIETYDPRALYDITAPRYAAAGKRYWPFAHESLVDLADLAPGDLVLDVACGPGPIAHRAARQVGADGWVLGVDLSPGMVRVAQRQAADDGVDNVSFFPADFHYLPFRAATFDRVTCGFALFFAPDPAGLLLLLWSLVKPGGRLAISTLAAEFFSPLFEHYLAALPATLDLQPLLPSRKIESLDALAQAFRTAGIPDPDLRHEVTPIRLASIDDWWEIVAATGIYRIDSELDPATAHQVRERVGAQARREDITTVDLGINYATATRPSA